MPPRPQCAARVYDVYGLRLRSSFPLACVPPGRSQRADVVARRGSPVSFARARRLAGRPPAWSQQTELPDGTRYLRWVALAEFLLDPHGRTVLCHPVAEARFPVAFETYLFGQVLSFVLIARGVEPLHATTVVVDGGAIAFVGDCGYGKSTLAATFLGDGARLLTDDLLVVGDDGGRFVGHRGPQRIKLFPETAAALLRDDCGAEPMNPFTPKRVIPIPDGASGPRTAPLRAIYVLAPPERRAERIAIRPLTPRRAFVELTRNTFNTIVIEPDRLARQLDLGARLAAAVPVKTLAMPRGLERLPRVRDAILADLVA